MNAELIFEKSIDAREKEKKVIETKAR